MVTKGSERALIENLHYLSGLRRDTIEECFRSLLYVAIMSGGKVDVPFLGTIDVGGGSFQPSDNYSRNLKQAEEGEFTDVEKHIIGEIQSILSKAGV